MRGCAVAKIIYNFGRADRVDVEQLRRLAKSVLRAVDGDVARAKDSVEHGDLRVRDAWPFGGVHVLEALWTELGLDQVVRSHARSKVTATAFERAIFAMVANRALSPYSKLYCWEQWVREEVYLPSAQTLSLHHLYFSMDFLEDHKEELGRRSTSRWRT
ncbi:MAG: hypothetical protein E6J90_41255 [Deltaproteobacteria bacterium]|nr:MAG: hypothetical protein E6J90_41255 [Deltaproteobacteria bacterium]TMQ16893.1 MAG: hypothetical protein E6J91_10940 [Deltaproteobacteria bacterium]